MAYILYSNGIVEEYRPKDLVFSENELLHLFSEFNEIKTSRLTNILNSWCIYGYVPNPEAIEFNRIASDIIKETIYSHVLFVHDSELDPEWKVTDTILYKGYNEFSVEIIKLIDSTASNILQEFQSNSGYENSADYLPQLISIGTTNDKRILFGFNPNEHSKEFYEREEFYIFSKKVYEYLIKNKQVKEPFTIYEDKKAIIVIDSINVKNFLTLMLEKFKNKEEYEICTKITKMISQWPPKKRKVTKKASIKK